MHPIKSTDSWLRYRAFWPLASEIDSRWHQNHYKVAALCKATAAVLLPAQYIMDKLITPYSWLTLVFAPMGAVIVFGYLYERRKLLACSKAYEQNTQYVPREAMRYWAFPPALRVFQLAWGLFFGFGSMSCHLTLSLGALIIYFLASLWFLLSALGDYFACLPPSSKSRREAPVKVPTTLAWGTT